MVRVRDANGKFIIARAILDTGASAHFVTENFVKRLHLTMHKCSFPIVSINSKRSVTKHQVQLTFRSIHNNFQKTLIFLTIPIISDVIPNEFFDRSLIKIPENIQLADPSFHVPRPVDILIGAGATLSLFSIGQIDLSSDGHELLLQKTQLGWAIAGELPLFQFPRLIECNFNNLESILSKFWEIEEIQPQVKNSSEDTLCEMHFQNNFSRDYSGRYSVRLPFKEANPSFSNSRDMALKRFLILERKFKTNPKLEKDYTEVMNEYINLQHMTLVNNSNIDGYYIPHHAVFKPTSTTTKTRVVFDASASSAGELSLNDSLLVGPTIQPKLFEQLIKARCHKILITADIEKMYRQIWIHESDRKYQRIFWRINNEIQTYQLNTVTFGVASSPFLAIRVLKQLADDDGYKFPLAANILRSDFYVDDLITGANNLSVAIQIQQELSQLLKNGGFKIRQWASNDPRVLVHCESDSINSNLLFDRDNILKTLGIYWNATSDSISYTVKPIAHTERITKRFILSEIAKIFDPLGLLGPVILFAKIIMQQCWKCKVSWDETVPTNLHTWSHFANQLNSLNNISVNRRLVVDDSVSIQIHGFCDASQFGYGACIYIRSIDNKGHIQSHLLCAKSRVIPVKGMTIPRAELSGALVLARLVNDIRTTLILQIDQIFLWCDSTITLHWINTSPNLLKIFVSNRVREIRELTTNCIWRHINTKNNPADALSRGQLPDAFLQNQMWFNGPSWLQQPESKWPNVTLQIPLEISEIRNNICLATTITNHTEFLNRFSSFRRAVRVISYCLRMKLNSQFKRTITIDEIHATEIQILRLVQAEAFHEEINVILTLNKMKKNRLTSLAPFLDKSGILRVGGRLIHSSLSHSQKHPILLPKNHHVTNIIISDAHLDNHHSGIQSTLHFIRHKYWLLDGKNQVRYVIHKCIPCFRFRAQPVSYKMGDLPEFRVNQARPFKNTGIDYCGPLFIKERKFRNRGRIKVYICVFICMTTRAIHLEVVSDMTTVGFLGALSRFIGRRGIPTNVYSDNGTNFIGANNELKQLYVLFNSESFHNEVNHFALRKHISWHFIPPLTPHFGGMWEAGVKSFKHHFKRVIGDRLTTFEELNTLVIEIESILNSRPLCAISSDPNDPTALTPAHWFIGEPFTALPEHDLLSVPENRLSSWQIIKKGRQEFWRRWSEEYLGELQKRYKWTESKGELQLGILVLIKDKNLPPLQWQLGRVIDLHPGLDGVVRVATDKLQILN
ncbi:uncharacterized protein [Prorops nasuta]|uniref:uncharacterized protein n=1 Tax=Prorops nasuta TaxID=863751 RepID=UPI0034CD45C5